MEDPHALVTRDGVLGMKQECSHAKCRKRMTYNLSFPISCTQLTISDRCAAARPVWRSRLQLQLLLLVLLLPSTLSGVGAVGWWGRRTETAGQRGAPPSDVPDDDDMDEAFLELERKQFWGSVERIGMTVIEDEVADKKRDQIAVAVIKACSVGAQMTLITGGAALFFRLLPILLGEDLEDEEAGDASPYLLEAGVDGSAPKALPAAARRRLLTNGGNTNDVDEQEQEEGEGEEIEEESGWAWGWWKGRNDYGKGAVVGVDDDRGVVTQVEGDDDDDADGGGGEVVVFSRRRAALKRASRVSRPFLKAMALPLATLLASRLILGDFLGDRVDPTAELLFGDDIVNIYGEKIDVPDEGDEGDNPMSFPLDTDEVPGRKKMKGKRVQRRPMPEGEGEDTEEGEDGVFLGDA